MARHTEVARGGINDRVKTDEAKFKRYPPAQEHWI